MTTGKELRWARRKAELKATDVARESGLSRTTLWAIEKAAEVRADQADSIRAAIARLTAEKAA